MDNDIPLTILISQEEKVALDILARQKRRDPENQAAIMIRRCLEEYGLIRWYPTSGLPIDEIPEVSFENKLLR